VDEDGDGVPDEPCTTGVPWFTTYHESAQDRFVAEWIIPDSKDGILAEDWLNAGVREVGALLVRVKEDPGAPRLEIRGGVAEMRDGAGFPQERKSGGFGWPFGGNDFSPAREVVPGSIEIRGFSGRAFERGDANSDDRVDLSDAIQVPGSLFLGSEGPGCEDAADADDTGSIEITDAIVMLGELFLGGEPIRPPHPGCGMDPTPDLLSCSRSGCGG
jgi:hypothetical protein